MIRHQLYPKGCECQDPEKINAAVDSVLEVEGHRFKIQPKEVIGLNQLVALLRPEGEPIGIDFRVRKAAGHPRGKLHVNSVRHRMMLHKDMRRVKAIYEESKNHER